MPIYKINDKLKPLPQQHNTNNTHNTTSCSTTKYDLVQHNQNGGTEEQHKDNNNHNNNNGSNNDTQQPTSSTSSHFTTLRRPTSKLRQAKDETIIEQEIRMQLEKEKEILTLHSIPSTNNNNNNNNNNNQQQQCDLSIAITKDTDPESVQHLNGSVASNRKVFERDLTDSQDKVVCRDETLIPHQDLNTQRQRTVKRSVVQPFGDVAEGLESKLKFIQPQNETVIEKEVRLTLQRDGSLRRARGYPLQVHQDERETNVEIPVLSFSINTPPGGKRVLQSSAEAQVADNSVVVKGEQINARRLATNRLKQEILKERLREVDLRKQGKIMTLSEERAALDAAVIEELVAKEMEERQRVEGSSSNGKNSVAHAKDGEKDQNHHVTSARTGGKGLAMDNRQGHYENVKHLDSGLDAESRIELEIKEIKRREQELRDQRQETGLSPCASPSSPTNQVTFITSYRRHR